MTDQSLWGDFKTLTWTLFLQLISIAWLEAGASAPLAAHKISLADNYDSFLMQLAY